MKRFLSFIFVFVAILSAETLFEVKDASNNKVLDVSTDGLRVMNQGDTLMVISSNAINANISSSKGLSRTFSVTTASSKGKGQINALEVGTEYATMSSGVGQYTDFSPDNIFIGLNAGKSTYPSGTYGIDNVFIGNYAGSNNSSGFNNIMIGDSAGVSNTTGVRNIFVGNKAGKMNESGVNNLFFGQQAGERNSTGSMNHFIGYQAGESNRSGLGNTYIGFNSGSDCTASLNTFVGCNTAYLCTTGTKNSILGYGAGGNLAGSENVLIGHNVAPLYQIGDKNVLIGSDSGYNLGDGSRGNVFIGFESGWGQSGNRSNTLIIESGNRNGNDMYNSLIYGNFENDILMLNAVTGIGGNYSPDYGLTVSGGTSPVYSALFYKGAYTYGSFVSGSDQKWKTNVETLNGSLDKIKNIRGVSFDWEKTRYPEKGFSDRKQIGVIAQEVEKVLPELVYTDENGDKGVDYAKMSAVLIEAVKELDAKTSKIEMLEDELENTKSEIIEIRKFLNLK